MIRHAGASSEAGEEAWGLRAPSACAPESDRAAPDLLLAPLSIKPVCFVFNSLSGLLSDPHLGVFVLPQQPAEALAPALEEAWPGTVGSLELMMRKECQESWHWVPHSTK